MLDRPRSALKSSQSCQNCKSLVACCFNSDVETVTLHTFTDVLGDAYIVATEVQVQGWYSIYQPSGLHDMSGTISYKQSETRILWEC